MMGTEPWQDNVQEAIDQPPATQNKVLMVQQMA